MILDDLRPLSSTLRSYPRRLLSSQPSAPHVFSSVTPSTSSPSSGPPPSPLYLILSSPPLLTVPDMCLLALSSSRQVINNRAHFFASCPQRSAFFSHLRNHGKIIFLLRTWHSPSHQGSEQDPLAHVPVFVFTAEHTPENKHAHAHPQREGFSRAPRDRISTHKPQQVWN